MQTVPFQAPRFPYELAQRVLCAVLQSSSPSQRAQREMTFAAPFGVALVTTLAVCARAGMDEQKLQRLAEEQADQYAHRLRLRTVDARMLQQLAEA
ncbi:MAG: hypothetical protein PHO92_03830 [Candidatus Peribacteraceae bacterium]|nr:hypothetical protein [Candidatus Peribacteraceae bacterium]